MGEIPLLMTLMSVTVMAFAVIGYFVARRMKRNTAVLAAGLIAAAMLLFGRYLADSVFIASIVPPRLLPVWGNWQPPMAGLLAGVGWVLSHRPMALKSLVLGALVVLSMVVPYRPLFAARPVVEEGGWHRGVLEQTTDATCGPAAAVTALYRIGIDSSEAEMVDLCFTTARGTSLHGLLRGLSVKLAGSPWEVRARNLTRGDLDQLRGPAILFVGLDPDSPPDPRFLAWGWQPGVAHTVVFFRIRPDGALDIGDPATGRERWGEEALEVLWKGQAVVIEPR